MTLETTTDAELVTKLRAHPELKQQIYSLVLAIENETGDLTQADTAELQIIEQMRQMGKTSLTAWANHQLEKETNVLLEPKRVCKDGKKLCWHTTFGEISINEQQLREGTRRIRPFVASAKVHHRGTSRPLQRAIVDFGADVSFAQAMDKLVEHYGVLLSESVIRRVTQRHARQMHERFEPQTNWPEQAGCDCVIVEMDGGMVPIVEPDEKQKDQRKGKQLYWKEAKIGLSHQQGSLTMAYGGTLQGNVDQAGEALFDCACQVGFGQQTVVHAVGDGAPWIADQIDKRFGTQGSYLIDFYHLCEYLSAAAKAIYSGDEASSAWLERYKQHLKQGDVETVLKALAPYVEAEDVDDTIAPVRSCYRYLSNRLDQLDYPSAVEQELPIGSGEIESAHRYVVQQRLKRSGAWWRKDNAEYMLALRLNRANRQWKGYWDAEMKEAA
ncbi:MAG: ISKra4 family transposase [Gammaproteobacteria bacterium]|nr:ISKra4 family transposase [Gammaproteobacteria bacterium]